jgi:hypothetical protein
MYTLAGKHLQGRIFAWNLLHGRWQLARRDISPLIRPRWPQNEFFARDWHAPCNTYATVEEWATARANRTRVRNFHGGSR